MTKDVLVSISGLHFETVAESPEAGEEIELVIPGTYYRKNGKHYILYEEIEEGGTGVTKNQVKILGGSIVEIRKSGSVGAHMVFEKNKQNLTYYQTPYGQMLVGTNTGNIEITVEEERIDVLIEYQLDVNHEPLADCKIKMNITPKTSCPPLI